MTPTIEPAHHGDPHEAVWAAIERDRAADRIGAANAEIREHLRELA